MILAEAWAIAQLNETHGVTLRVVDWGRREILGPARFRNNLASGLNDNHATFILRTLLEDIPHRGRDLADGLKTAGAVIEAAAEKKLAEFYPLTRGLETDFVPVAGQGCSRLNAFFAAVRRL
jgi:hypothetical protein